MKITYIYHSGFVVEEGEAALLIDFYHDTDGDDGHGYVRDEFLKRKGRLYVLATHFHPDHFNPEVLKWRTLRPDIRYIFSKDILKHRRAAASDAVYLKKGEVYEDDCLTVRAFGSTDVGDSFLIDFGGKRIFHAGDLNNWHWKDESTDEEVRKAEGDYLAELRDIVAFTSSVDVAMFPVDRRMGSDYMRGAEQWIETVKTEIFLPMHFSEDYEGGNAFRIFAEAKNTDFCTIRARGETFELD